MGILKFLSFGGWDVLLKPDALSFFIIIFWVIIIMYVIKLIGLFCIDFAEVRGMIRLAIVTFTRILQILLQLSVLFIFASIGNFDLLMSIMCLGALYHLCLGIYFISDEYNTTYVYYINRKIVKYIDTHFESYDVSFSNKRKFKNINKTIYVYRKNTIVN